MNRLVVFEDAFLPIDGIVSLHGCGRQVLEHPMRNAMPAIVRHDVIFMRSHVIQTGETESHNFRNSVCSGFGFGRDRVWGLFGRYDDLGRRSNGR